MALPTRAILFSMIKKRNSRSMNREMIGYEIIRNFPPIQKEDVLQYVEATGDNPELYKDDACAAPPFYVSRLLYPMFEHMMTLPDLKLNILKMVHGQQQAKWTKTLHLGEPFTMKMDIMNIEDSPAGEIIHLRTRAYIKDEETVEAVTSFIVRGTGNRKDAPKHPAPHHGKEILRTEFQTHEGQQLKYAEVSRDKNFMHTSNFLAKLAGLPRTIMHGVCTAAMAVNAIRDSLFDGDIEKMESVSLRFAKPVFPGDRVTIVIYEAEEKNIYYFEGLRDSGKHVIKHGILTVRG